jgi:hypothetical protein
MALFEIYISVRRSLWRIRSVLLQDADMQLVSFHRASTGTSILGPVVQEPPSVDCVTEAKTRQHFEFPPEKKRRYILVLDAFVA